MSKTILNTSTRLQGIRALALYLVVKNIRATTILFWVFSSSHQIEWIPPRTSSHSKTFVFIRRHEYDKPPFSKVLSVERVASIPTSSLLVTQNTVCACKGAKNEEKYSGFRKSPDTCGRGFFYITIFTRK